MSSSDPALTNIATVLKNITNYIPQQDAINSDVEQRLASFETILETLLQSIQHLKILATPNSHQEPPLQGTSLTSPTASSPSNDATVKSITTPTWADITSRPPAPLTDRRRQALHRFFSPKDAEPSNANSYTFVYLHLSSQLTRTQIRSKLRAISIDNLRVLDIIFPARHIIGILIHEAYLSEFRSKLLEIDTSLIPSFNPLDPDHIADPKYHDLPKEERTRLARSLHQDRCLRTLSFVRPNLLPGIARYFVRQGWVPDHLAQDVLNNRLPRSSLRRPIPYPSSVMQALQSTNTTTRPPSNSLPHQPSALHSVSEDSEMDAAPDQVSTPSNPNERHPPSPPSSPRKLRKSSRLRRSKS
ncbi:unnamed protein product [Mucor circinelloides]